ncbi:tigger transposable element-derived protein 3 [Vombatus ursinus]|uniref:Tigger transposable element derived 3 n=1 Tax=Vombatus ursinus TaxID=29139 RepID=A0A4X2JX71_VOMUR|nr:tigger transposable element-derived protein 3 [Vombatus ursinus]
MELGGKKKLHALSLAEKIQVLELLDESKMSQSEVARRFQVSQPQISRICKNKEKLLADWCSGTANRERKRKRESKYSGIDEALLCWYHIARAKAWDITGPMLLHKAKELADLMGQHFVPSIGWLVRWKRRNNVGLGARHGLPPPPLPPRTSPEPPPLGSDPHTPITLKDFSPDDIFGCTEVPLLYRAVPGRVVSSDQLQVLLCANSGGTEKRRLMVVGGRQPSPRCFFGVSSEALPVLYRPGPGIPWADWLAQLDQDMGQQGRHVALLLTAHPARQGADLPELQHVRLLPLPADGTMPCLPTPVVRDFKTRYRHRLLSKLAALRGETEGTSLADAGAGITVLDALHMMAAAWDRVPASFIRSSFALAGLWPSRTAPSTREVPKMPPLPDGLRPEEFSRFVDLEGEEADKGRCKEEVISEGEEENRDDGFVPLPTKADALRALGTLRRWFECNGASPELFGKFYDCEEEAERMCYQ